MKRMLVIEDDILTQGIYKRLFKDKFEIDFTDSAEKFYSELVNKKYDIAIIDISLKGKKDGLQLISEIRANPVYGNIPILCITAHALTRDRMSATTSGADIFLTKPIDNKYLLEIVDFFINK